MRVAIASAVMLAMLPLSSANAARCGPRQVIVSTLEHMHNENQRAIGIDANGNVMEIWATASGSTWTQLVSMAASENACIVMHGTDYIPLSPPKPKGKES